MFTIKHYPAGGPRRFLSCESFEHDQAAGVVRLNRPDEDLLIADGDVLFAENAQGKTVYVIRPPREEG